VPTPTKAVGTPDVLNGLKGAGICTEPGSAGSAHHLPTTDNTSSTSSTNLATDHVPADNANNEANASTNAVEGKIEGGATSIPAPHTLPDASVSYEHPTYNYAPYTPFAAEVKAVARREQLHLATSSPHKLRSELASRRRLCAALELQLKATAGHVASLRQELTCAAVAVAADTHDEAVTPHNTADGVAGADTAWSAANPTNGTYITPVAVATTFEQSGLSQTVLRSIWTSAKQHGALEF
jgi:hypothetical protein